MGDSIEHPFGAVITTATEETLLLDIPSIPTEIQSENPIVAETEKLPQTIKTDSVNNCAKGSGKGEKENITVTKTLTQNDIHPNIMADKLHQVQPMSNRTNRSGSGVLQNAQEMKPFNQKVYHIKTEKLQKSSEKPTNSEVRVIYNHCNPDTGSKEADDSDDCTIIQIHLDEENNENDNLISCNNGKKEELSEGRNEAKFKNGSSAFVSNSKTLDNLVPIQTFTEKVSAWMQHNNYREPSIDMSLSSDDNIFMPSSLFYVYMEDEDADDKDEYNVLRDGYLEDEVTILDSSSTDTQSESSSSGCSTSSSHEEFESDSDDCCILLENEILGCDKDQLSDTVPVPVAQANTQGEGINSNSAINEDDATKTIITNDNAEDEIIFIKEQQCPRKVGSLLNLKWNRPVPITVLNYRRRQMLLLKSAADEALKNAALASAREASKRKLSGVNDTTSEPKLGCDIPPSEDAGSDCDFTKEASAVYLRPAKLKRVSFNSTM